MTGTLLSHHAGHGRPSRPSSGGPGLPVLLSTLVAGAGAAFFFASRLTRSPAIAAQLGTWIQPPASAGVLAAVAAVALVPAVAVLASPRLRPAAVALALPSGLLALLCAGPLPHPLRALALAPSLLASAGARPPTAAAAAEAAALLVAALAAAFALQASASRGASPAARLAHGSARFASRRDLAAADLLSGEGMVLGSIRTRTREIPLTDRSSDHALVLMTTGGGKTSGPLATTLLNTDDPALVVDPKGELWALSAGYRHSCGHTVVRFSPFDGEPTCRWNPLDEIVRGPGEVTTLGVLAGNLITYPAESHGETHWTASARSLLRCLALHVLYAEGAEASLAGVRELLNSRTELLGRLFKALASTEHDPSGEQAWTTLDGAKTRTHPEVRRLASAFASTPARELGSIVSTLNRFLDLWGDPRVAAATKCSDWSLDLLAQRRSVTVYVTAPTTHLALLGPLLRILVSLLAFRLSDDGGEYRDEAIAAQRRLLLVLDEFAALGRVPILEDLLAFTRGYGVRAIIAVQDLAQLVRLYGPHHTFAATCRLHVAAATADVSTRNEISRRLGESTYTYRKRSRSGSLLAARTTVSQAEVRRPLLTEGEIGELGDDRLLVVKAGHPPILAGKLPYWSHPDLDDRRKRTAPDHPWTMLRDERRRKRAATQGEAP